jgi:catechol 2,3-dioxygenase
MTGTDARATAGHRLPAALRLGAVHLQVSDLGRSVEYYERVVGLRAIAHSPGRATLAARGDDAPLVELHERAGAVPVPRRGRLGLYHFAARRSAAWCVTSASSRFTPACRTTW